MLERDRLRLIFHGAVVVLFGLLCGLPTAVESLEGDVERLWHTAHEALIMIGVWIVAAAFTYPLLHLAARERKALYLSLLGMGYGLAFGLILGGAIGLSPFSPGPSALSLVAFVAALVGIMGSFLSAGLVAIGAHAAARQHLEV